MRSAARLSVVLIVTVSLLLPLPVAAAPAPLTPDQVLSLRAVGAFDLSPDGKLAVYTVTVPRAADEPVGGDWRRLYAVPAAGGDPRPLVTGRVSVGAPRFSPDGRWIGFTLKRGEGAKTQVWVLPTAGGEALPATASPTGVAAWAWSADGASLFYVALSRRSERARALDEAGYRPRFYEEDLRSRDLFRVAFRPGEPPAADTLLAGRAVWSLAVDPAGRYLAVGVSDRNLVDQRYMFQRIELLDLADGGRRVLVDPPGKLGGFRFAPGGERLAWTAAASRSDHAVSRAYVVELATGEVTALTADDFPGHVHDVRWLDDRTLLTLADEGTGTTLGRQRLGDHPQRRRVVLAGGDGGAVFGGPVRRPGVRTMLLAAHSRRHPRELFRWDGKGAPVRLTDVNPWLADAALGRQETVTWTARDGLELQGVLVHPVDGASPAPLVVQVHGGPESRYADGWLTRYSSPVQLLAGKGYAVFLPNYRGSTGRGVAFAALAYGDPAGPEFDDIVDGVRALVENGVADPGRVGVMGGSYGGYAANWLAVRASDTFRAAVAFVGISDLVSKRFLTDIPYEDEYVHMGRPVRETWDLMRERSPVRWAERCRTPLLICHGDSDTRVHPSQSQEMYRALKMAGWPHVRLVYYPGEGHGNRRRPGRADFLLRSTAWFDWYLRDGRPRDGDLPPLDVSAGYGLDLDAE